MSNDNKLQLDHLLKAASSASMQTSATPKEEVKKWPGEARALSEYKKAITFNLRDVRYRQFFDASNLSKKYGSFGNFINTTIVEQLEKEGFENDFKYKI